MRSAILVLWVAACSPYPDLITTEGSSTPTFGTGLPTDGATDTGTMAEKARFARLESTVDSRMGTLVTVSWMQAARERVRVEYSVDPGMWVSAPSFEGVEGRNEQLLVGIPFSDPAPAPAREVPWRVVSEHDDFILGAPEPIVPSAADPALPLPTLVTSVPNRWDADGNFLLTTINQEHGGWTGGRFWVAIYDRKGRAVWALPVPNHHWSLSARVSQHGDAILWDESTRWSDGDAGEGSLVHRTWLDREAWVLRTPGLHHMFLELPEGAIAWGSQLPAHGLGETIVEKRPEEAAAAVVWRCSDWASAPEDITECEANSLVFDESSDSYLVGFFGIDAAVSVARQSGDVGWWVGSAAGAYRFGSGTTPFAHPHSVTLAPGGNLLVAAEDVDAEPRRTTLREYSLNHPGKSLTEVWSHDSGAFATTNAYAERLEGGNVLHALGSASRIEEVDASGRTVWHLDFGGSRLLGRAEFVHDLYDLVSPPTK